MKIINFGSLNYDKVYSVQNFVTAGETILAENYNEFLGGKGLNQSVALARAGAEVYHFGAVGKDGNTLLDYLKSSGVDVSLLLQKPSFSGHAIIQVENGQNCIIVYGGSNQLLQKEDIDNALLNFGVGDILLLQNEVSNVAYAIEAAKSKGLSVAINVSPINEAVLNAPLHLVDIFLVNEIEAMAIAGCNNDDFNVVLCDLQKKYPNATIVLTLGKKGVLYRKGNNTLTHGIYNVSVVDTTGAGDTFCGYFIAGLAQGMPAEECLRYASLASSIAVSKMGAANSIPTKDEVVKFGKTAT